MKRILKKRTLKNKLIMLAFVFMISFAKVNGANFVIGFMGQFGVSSATTEKGKIFNSDFREFENSFAIQPGIFFSYYDTISSAIFFDIGCNNDRYEFRNNIDNNRIVENFSLHNISVGILPRINFGFLSIGIGGGVKFPIAMTYLRENKDNGDLQEKRKLVFGDIRDTLKDFYNPYLKASVDFLIKGKDKFMITAGVYANYDFAFNLKEDGILTEAINRENVASFDIGFQIGLYFISL